MSKALQVFRRLFSSTKASFPVVTKPSDLKQSHVNNVYCVPHREVKQLYPMGFPRNLLKQGEMVGNVCWILRDQSWNMMEKLQDNSNHNGFVLYGPSGSGKTVSLLQTIHQCILNQWIVVHIPSVFAWVHPKSEFKQARQQGTYDIPNESCSWLQYFRAMNLNQLGQIKLSESYSWTKKEHSSKGDDLLKAIEQGVIRPNIATDVAHCVLKELSTLKSHKVVMVIDDFNACFVPKALKHPESGEWISADNINFVKHLLDYALPSKINGPVVTALSRRLLRYENIQSDTPDNLLGSKGMTYAKDFVKIEVPHFSKEEMKQCLEYYNHQKLLSRKVDSKIFNELWHLSGAGNPGELDKLCRHV